MAARTNPWKARVASSIKKMGTSVRNRMAEVYRDEAGASLVEYILLAVLIGVAAIAGMTFLGSKTNNKMNNIGEVL